MTLPARNPERTPRRPRKTRWTWQRLFVVAPTCIALLAVAHAGQLLAQQPKGDAALKAATETAKKIQETTGAKPAQAKVPPGDPCTVLSLSDVQKVFPGAKAGERSRRLEQYGITECAWKGADGRVVLGVQESYGSDSAKDDVQTMAMGITDPLQPKSRGNVRYETFPALGSEAMAFVEQADAKRGILGDGAYMAMHRGERLISLSSGVLPQRDRAAALKALEELGKVAAKRLQ